MIGRRIIHNGEPADPSAAVFPLDDLDVTYGYGCYETLKVRGGRLWFPEFHEERLLSSAAILGIRHSFAAGSLAPAIRRLAELNGIADCNVKVMLIGHEGRDADWYAFLLPAPVVPPESYGEGVRCLAFRGQRHFPRAKSLSMLLSTVAYREAARAGCHDALLVNERGQLTEGTRTNLFWYRHDGSDRLFTPPACDVLEGVTRRTLLAALDEAGLAVEERPLSLDDARSGACGLLVTGTSIDVLPVRALVDTDGAETALRIGPPAARVMAVYAAWLARRPAGDSMGVPAGG